jgi:hypothetical protein
MNPMFLEIDIQARKAPNPDDDNCGWEDEEDETMAAIMECRDSVVRMGADRREKAYSCLLFWTVPDPGKKLSQVTCIQLTSVLGTLEFVIELVD